MKQNCSSIKKTIVLATFASLVIYASLASAAQTNASVEVRTEGSVSYTITKTTNPARISISGTVYAYKDRSNRAKITIGGKVFKTYSFVEGAHRLSVTRSNNRVV